MIQSLQIYNADETGIYVHKPGNVIAMRGRKKACL